MFETVSFHIVKPCNMKCKFCYATFNDMNVKMMSEKDAEIVIAKLKSAGVQKITFAGGEPMLYPYLDNVIQFSKDIGLTTSIITNGSFITTSWLEKMKGTLDWIGISIDSLSPITNFKIGRIANFKEFDTYENLITSIKNLNFKLKINTVVNAYNWNENMLEFITKFEPNRWKVFQALRVEGQNDDHFNQIKITKDQFNYFLNNNSYKTLVPENNAQMTGSYLLIDPQGRLFENSQGKHSYSDTLISNDINKCLSQIKLNRNMFIERGGIYNW